jgi:ABC-2 type transport system ATP-binding protein
VPQVYGRLTCDDHIELFGAAYGLSPSQARASARGLYEALGFGGFADTRADELSGGTLAKLNLSLALLADPEVRSLMSRTRALTSTPT